MKPHTAEAVNGAQWHWDLCLKTHIYVISHLLTSKAPLRNHTNGFPEVAPWLESASIGINVNVAYWLLNPNASAR